MKHRQHIKGDYVLAPVKNAFNDRTSYWISKRGYTNALYVTTPCDDYDIEQLDEDFDDYIKYFEEYLQNLAENRRIEVLTSAGALIAERIECVEAPAISLSFVPKGKFDEIDMAIAEVKEDVDLLEEDESIEDISLYLYEDIHMDVWTRKVNYKRADVISVFP